MASSQFGAGIIDQESLNCGTISLTFLLVVLPVLKSYVLDKMKHYYEEFKKGPLQVRQPSHKKSLKDRLPTDPRRTSVKLNIPTTQITIQDHNELAKLYLTPLQLKSFQTLDNCDDYGILLSIMSAGCFGDNEANLAQNLRGVRNYTAHTQIAEFTNEYTQDVLINIEKLLLILSMDTKNQRRDLQQVKKFGSLALLLNRTGQQITAIRKSLERYGSIIHTSVRASIESTLTKHEQDWEDIELTEQKMGGKWAKLPYIFQLPCEELSLVTLKGKSAGLQSLISAKHPKTKTTSVVGFTFKIADLPFDKGTSRLAYRGHFDDAWMQIDNLFKDFPEVVIKVSSEDASVFQKVHLYAEIFAEEWNQMRGKDEIIFINIRSVKLQRFEGTQTIEPYLNRKLYKKW